MAPRGSGVSALLVLGVAVVLVGCSSSRPAALATTATAPATSTGGSASGAPTTPSAASASSAPTVGVSAQPASSLAPSPANNTAATTPTSASVPAGFQPASVTFVSASLGYLLGTAPCAKPCTTLVATRDAGHSWSVVSTLPPGLTGDNAGVTKVRFANSVDGWAFGPQLWATHDGGRSWRQLAEPGAVSDVEAAAGVAYALVASCAAEPCAGGAKFLRTAVSADAWAPVAGVVVPSPSGSIALHGKAAWVATANGPGTGKLVATSDGVTWRTLADPCGALGADWALGGVAPVTSTSVYLLCGGGGAAGSEEKKVLLSTDGGAHGTATSADPPRGGDEVGIAAASTAVVTVSARSGASWVYRSADGGRSWAAPLTKGDGGVGYFDVGFTTATQGVAIYGSPSIDTSTEFLMTRDAGATWSQIRF